MPQGLLLPLREIIHHWVGSLGQMVKNNSFLYCFPIRVSSPLNQVQDHSIAFLPLKSIQGGICQDIKIICVSVI